MSNRRRIKSSDSITPLVLCSICGLPIAIGDMVRITCVGFRDEEPILNPQHESCLSQEAKNLGGVIDAEWAVGSE